MMWTAVLLSLALVSFSLAQSPCASGATRVSQFTRSQVSYAGIVQVCLNGVWGTVCADSRNTFWSEKNAQVFCQSLGFSGALNPVDQSTIDPSYLSTNLSINYKDVRCNGTETSLSQCSHSENTTGCTHASDVAVVCRQNVSDGDVRLVGSTSNGQGAVEIYHQTSRQWYRVCPTGWKSSDASVVCQLLGYYSGVAKTYNLGSGAFLNTSSASCTYTKCLSRGYMPCDAGANSSAGVNYSAGVSCISSGNAKGSIRLSGANTGRVEVLYNGVWGTVCNKSWTIFEAQAVCNVLGYNTSTVSITGLRFTGYSFLYPIWTSGLKCNSSSISNISQCTYNSPIGFGQSCSHVDDALVDCGSSSSSSSSLGALGALAVVAGVPAAAAKYWKPIAKFFSECGKFLRCCSFVWLRHMATNIRWLLCCAFLVSWRAQRNSVAMTSRVPVTVTSTTTTITDTTQATTTIYPPANSEVVVTVETESYKPTNPELSQAPPPTYKDASNYNDASLDLPPQYNVPPPQYSADFPTYPGPEVDPPAGPFRM